MTNQTQTDRLAEAKRWMGKLPRSQFDLFLILIREEQDLGARRIDQMRQSLSTDLANAEARVKEVEAENVRIRKHMAVEGLERLIEGLEEIKSEMPDLFEYLLLMPEVRQLRAALNPGKESA